MKHIPFALITLLTGVVLTYTGWLEYSHDRQLADINATQQIMSNPMYDYLEEVNDGQVIGYHLVPTFSPQAPSDTYPDLTYAPSYKCYGAVSKDIIDDLQDNPVIRITYVTQDPSICRIEGAFEEHDWLMGILGLVLLIPSAGYLYHKFKSKKSLEEDE